MTIWAPATAAGKAGIAVIRVSGPRAGDVGRLIGAEELPPARLASRRRFVDPATGEPIDDGLLLWFPGPRSFTGEDLLEIHHHGSRAVVATFAAAFAGIEDIRPAEPGEFTKRAFLQGKLDLAEVEGLADLLEATTRAQARQALRQLSGVLGKRCADWREVLLQALALIEAEIDFAPEEGDVADDLLAVEAGKLATLRAEIAAALDGADRGERLREGLVVAVTGAPNVGKSSIINVLAKRDVAIVTQHAGTTRDVLEVALELRGLPVLLLDTAGLRETSDPIEREGVERGCRRASEADLRLYVIDASAPEEAPTVDPQTLIVLNKLDLVSTSTPLAGTIGISCLTGEGFDWLIDFLAMRAEDILGTGETSLITRERHRTALTQALRAIDRFFAIDDSRDLGLQAEELRLALDELGRITGRVRVEEVLDRIFAQFCIGK